MPTAADLKWYASVNMPDDDVSACGGGIDLTRTIAMSQLAANDDVEVVSSAAGDTMNCTIEGRSAAGVIVTETKALTGTTPAVFSTLGIVERILRVELASACAGTVTVRRSPSGSTIGTLAPTQRGFMALFRKCAADPSAVRDYYCKVFVKNEHATQSLTAWTIAQASDPDSRITHCLSAALNDSGSSANRLTAPAANFLLDPDVFDDTDKTNSSVPDFLASLYCGVWLRLRLPAGDSAHKANYGLLLRGTSV